MVKFVDANFLARRKMHEDLFHVKDPRNDLPASIQDHLATQLRGIGDQIVDGWLGYENLGND